MIRLAVKAAVLDEDISGLPAGHGAAGDEQVRHVGLERLRIERRRQRLRVALDACSPSSARRRDDSRSAGRRPRPESPRARPAVSMTTAVGVISTTRRLEPRRNRAFLDAVLDVGPHPVLDRIAERGVPVHERDVHAGAEQLERTPRPRSSCRRRRRRAAGSTGARRCSSARRAADPRRARRGSSAGRSSRSPARPRARAVRASRPRLRRGHGEHAVVARARSRRPSRETRSGRS